MRNKFIGYLLPFFFLMICYSCSKKGKVHKDSFLETLEYFEKLVLQDKKQEYSYSFSLDDDDGKVTCEMKYIGAIKGCQTEFDILLEEICSGVVEVSKYNGRLVFFSSNVKLGTYWELDGYYNINLTDCGMVVSNKETGFPNTISFTEGIPDEIYIADSMDKDSVMHGNIFCFSKGDF